MPYAP
ncbi:uncharacterized protein FTOL_13902 [Fusarium torulosum]